MKEPVILKTGSRVILGKNHVFRFTHPGQPRDTSALNNKEQNDTPETVADRMYHSQTPFGHKTSAKIFRKRKNIFTLSLNMFDRKT